MKTTEEIEAINKKRTECLHLLVQAKQIMKDTECSLGADIIGDAIGEITEGGIERRCEPCEHHKCMGSFHVRSGEGSWREYVCQHPAADDELTPAGRALFGAGKYIGKTKKQPDWCPLRQSQNKQI